MSRRQHELVTVRMLGAPVVVAERAQLGPDQMRRDVERRVGQRAAEMPGLGIVAEQGEGHAGHVADVFQTAPFVGKPGRHVRPWRRVNTHRSLPSSVRFAPRDPCMSIMTVSSAWCYFAAAGNAGSLPMSRMSCWMMTVALRLAAICFIRSIEAIVAARSKLNHGTPLLS